MEFIMQLQVQYLVQKLERLPPQKLIEVDDFIDFLQQREQENHLRQHFTEASHTSFAKVWDNDDDAIYDNL